jgi:hypothetical protein
MVFGLPVFDGDSVPRSMIDLALRQGYWTWEFAPSYRNNPEATKINVEWISRLRHDRTLRADGSRSGRFPGWCDPLLELFPFGIAPYRVDYDFVTRRRRLNGLY